MRVVWTPVHHQTESGVVDGLKTLRGFEDEGYKDGMNHEYEPPHSSIFEGYSHQEVEELKAYNKGHEDAKKDRD